MTNKRILIVSTGLRIGGVERSLIGLLEAFDYDRYAVDLFLYSHDGEFMRMIPSRVNLLAENKGYASIEKPIRNVLFSKQYVIAIARLAAKLVTAIRSRFLRIDGFLLPRSVRYCLPFLASIPGDYDLAISFLTPHAPLLKKVNAKRRVGWIHTDYSMMESGVDDAFELPMWKGLDAIAAVSDSVRDTFAQVFPEVEEKLVVIENIVSPDTIRREARALHVSSEMPVVSNETVLCSVGRFCHQKNFDSIPKIVRQLNNAEVRVRWYLIGYGGGEAVIRRAIKACSVEGQVIVLGKRTNPYPYMKACDLYVQPSRYEGKAVTVREAQILGKPVIITDFPTAKSQLEDGVDGLICPLSIEGVTNGIKQLIEDFGLRERLAAIAASRDYSNRQEIDKIVRLLEGE